MSRARSRCVRRPPHAAHDPGAAHASACSCSCSSGSSPATRCRRCSASGPRRRTSPRSAHELGLDEPLSPSTPDWLGGPPPRRLRPRLRQPAPRSRRCSPRALPVTLELTLLVDGLATSSPACRSACSRRAGAPAGAAPTKAFVIAGISIPDFWLGIMLVLLFAGTLGWLPPSGYVPFTRTRRQPALHGAAGR